MRVALVRHPAVQIPPGICYGRLDVPLASNADTILAGLAAFPATRIFTSPASRCRIVANAIAQAHGAAVVPDDRLWELHFGDWEGMRWDDVPRQALDRWAADPAGFAPPGGESGAALIARVRAFQAALDGDAIVVSHGGPLKVLAALLRGAAVDLLAPAPALGSVEIVTWRRAR